LDTIYPVILSVPAEYKLLSGKDKVLSLSRFAREALLLSAQKSGIHCCRFLKDPDGVPIPFKENYWSVTHKPEYVGGIIASTKIGIDIEKIKPCSRALFRKTADEKEWKLSDTDPFTLFFRFWTSKETVIKAVGTGIKDLLKCRIVQIIDDNNLVANYQNRDWIIEHFYFDQHIASVVKNKFHIEWTLSKALTSTPV
jgi:4'-phosphopantetheinyl transferase